MLASLRHRATLPSKRSKNMPARGRARA
jgi:hypothetical protein